MVVVDWWWSTWVLVVSAAEANQASKPKFKLSQRGPSLIFSLMQKKPKMTMNTTLEAEHLGLLVLRTGSSFATS
jgi:hypothetical protein